MSLEARHADGTTPITALNPLEGTFTNPAVLTLVCTEANEETLDDVVLTVPAGVEFAVGASGGTFAEIAPNLGVVGTTPVVCRLRPQEALRYTHTTDIGGGEFACVAPFFALPDGWPATQVIPDTVPPTLGASFTATPGEISLALAWDAATDDRGVESYEYQVATDSGFTTGLQTATTATLGATLSLAAGTWYARVRAFDGTNYSSWSATETAVVTPATDTTAPTLGGTLTASMSDTQASLDWQDATDNVGVTGYDVQYKQTSSGTWIDWTPDPTSSTQVITSLVAATSYDFRVRAYDAAGNPSSWLTATASTTESSWVDTFDRANSDTVGNDWVEAGVTASQESIASNALVLAGNAIANIRRTLNVPTTYPRFVEIEGTTAAAGSLAWVGFSNDMISDQAGTNRMFMYLEIPTGFSGTVNGYVFWGSAPTSAGSFTTTVAPGDRLRLVHVDATHANVLKNGVLVQSFTLGGTSPAATATPYAFARCTSLSSPNSGAYSLTLNEIRIG